MALPLPVGSVHAWSRYDGACGPGNETASVPKEGVPSVVVISLKADHALQPYGLCARTEYE